MSTGKLGWLVEEGDEEGGYGFKGGEDGRAGRRVGGHRIQVIAPPRPPSPPSRQTKGSGRESSRSRFLLQKTIGGSFHGWSGDYLFPVVMTGFGRGWAGL